MSFSSHPEIRNLDETETLVTKGDVTDVREVTETDLYNCMCLYFLFVSICVFSEFELVSILSKKFNAFKDTLLIA